MSAIALVPRCEIAIRPAVAGDLAFVDRLQDMHCKMVGYMPTKQLESKIEAGHVLIAEDAMRLPVGYCIATDRYFKRDDVGIVYQMNIAPGQQRKLVGASLLKAVFERAAYGCKLFCCWCAQDIEANHFWESLGFIPLAFRTGAVGKGKTRTHVFWQRRIREGDVTTPYWFPAKTDGGALRGDRIVLPIPPGVKWSDEMPVLSPTAGVPEVCSRGMGPMSLTDERTKHGLKTRATGDGPPKPMPPTPMPPTRRRVQFGPPPSEPEAVVEKVIIGAKTKRAKKPKVKADPAHIAKARELRDRYLEHLNGEQFNGEQFNPAGLPRPKYEVSRMLPSIPEPKQLPEAA